MTECKELAGKVVRVCHLYDDGSDGPELQIDFTDGTCFIVGLKTRVALEAKCVKSEGGEPIVVKDYTPLTTSRLRFG
jgi:hypothetical protein